MNRRLSAASVAAAVLLAGCETLVPYESEFMCEKSQDFGKCMNVQDAYQEALGAEATNPARIKPEQPEPEVPMKRGAQRGRAPATAPAAAASPGTPQVLRTSMTLSPEELYRDREYRELAGLIEQPVTPIVKPPKVLRTLIVSYTAGESLFMPRYVYYFADEARFVLGDYLTPTAEPKNVFPNGPTTAQR